MPDSFLKIPALAISAGMVAFFHIHEIGLQCMQSGFLKSFQESCIFRSIGSVENVPIGTAEVD